MPGRPAGGRAGGTSRGSRRVRGGWRGRRRRTADWRVTRLGGGRAAGARACGHRPDPDIDPQQAGDGTDEYRLMTAAGEASGLALTGECDRQHGALYRLGAGIAEQDPGDLALIAYRVQDLGPALAERVCVRPPPRPG